jgi:hypothetical protein
MTTHTRTIIICDADIIHTGFLTHILHTRLVLMCDKEMGEKIHNYVV